MPKMLFVIFLALSPAFLAKADTVVADCAGPVEGGLQNGTIDATIANEINKDWAYLKGYKEGYVNHDSANHEMIGGKGKVCDRPGERAYVCDLEGAVYCTVGFNAPDRVDVYTSSVATSRSEREKGRDNDQDVLRGCKYAGDSDFRKEPLKNQVAPASWNDDASKCGFAEGYFHLPCKYVYVVHGVKSEHQIKEQQEKIQDKEREHLFRNTCRSDNGAATRDRRGKKIHSVIGPHEDVRDIIGDYENEGEKWRTHNQTPDSWGSPAPPPAPVAPVTPVTPPAPPVVQQPVTPPDACSEVKWDSYHDCPPLWAECRGHVPPPRMPACNCSLENCSKVLDYVASRFPDLSQNSGAAAFFARNQIKERAQIALNKIENFRAALRSEQMPGTYYQNGDIDHCIYARFLALANNRNVNGTCVVKSDTRSLATLESDLTRLTSNQDISGVEMNKMQDEFNPIDLMAANFRETPTAKVSTEKVLGGQASPALTEATHQMMLSLYSLSIADEKAPFSDLAKNDFNYKYFRNRTEKRLDHSSAQGFKEEVNTYYAGYNHGDACIQTPVGTDTSAMNSFESMMRDYLHWDQVFAQLDMYCSGDPNHYPSAGTAKKMATDQLQKSAPTPTYNGGRPYSRPYTPPTPPLVPVGEEINVDGSTLR